MRSDYRGSPYLAIASLLLALLLTACSSQPVAPESGTAKASPPLPDRLTDVSDQREHFWYLYCQLNRQVGTDLPDYRPCEEALVAPPHAQSPPVQNIDRSSRLRDVDIVMVPGLGWDCIAEYVGTPGEHAHAEALGYRITVPRIEGLSSSSRNAQLIYGHLVNSKLLDNGRELVFIGYSKGIIDVLEMLVTFPHAQQQTLAVISMAGAVWGTPMADITPEKMLDAYNLVPGKDCFTVDHDALESLRPAIREQWMADHGLPEGIHYYSLVTLPEPDNISRALKSSYKKLSKYDPRNDSQLIYHDQILPGSSLLAYINADHLAVAVPISRGHPVVGKLALTRNDFPRELLLETVLRYVEADVKPTMGEQSASDPAAPDSADGP